MVPLTALVGLTPTPIRHASNTSRVVLLFTIVMVQAPVWSEQETLFARIRPAKGGGPPRGAGPVVTHDALVGLGQVEVDVDVSGERVTTNAPTAAHSMTTTTNITMIVVPNPFLPGTIDKMNLTRSN